MLGKGVSRNDAWTCNASAVSCKIGGLVRFRKGEYPKSAMTGCLVF